MTREEEINQVANNYRLSTIKHKDIERSCYARVDFIAGARWADEHPKKKEEHQRGLCGNIIN